MNNNRRKQESDTSKERIPADILNTAVENAAIDDRFVIPCTDGDIEYAQTREEAEQVAQEMRAMREFFAGASHETEILEL
jgi:hypothetical protein